MGKPVEVNDKNFEDFIKKNPAVVVDCWAAWCAPCRMVGPVVEELAKDLDGKVVFGKLDVDSNRNVSSKYRIMSIPTMLYFKDGKLAGQSVGAMPKEMIMGYIQKNLKI